VRLGSKRAPSNKGQWDPDRRETIAAYSEVNARSSSRAASLKDFSGSIPAPLFAQATVRGRDMTRILLIMAYSATSS
jgi:hypothetical protein